MNDALPIDASALREEVKAKYRAVAVDKRRVFSEILRVLRPRGGACSLPTSRMASRYRKRRSATSTCGPIEFPAACRVQAGGRCSSRAVSLMSGSARR